MPDIETKLRSAWANLAIVGRWPAAQADALGAEVIARLSEPHRAYHNGHHILALLRHAGDARAMLADPFAVQLAIWFHDIIYDPRASDNEAQSAALAQARLSGLPNAVTVVPAVTAMIEATARHQVPAGAPADCALFLDFDLSILGSAPDAYRVYAAAIRAEYAHVPEDAYRTGRAKVLETFLKRDVLYQTVYGRDRWEQQARKNVAMERDELLGS